MKVKLAPRSAVAPITFTEAALPDITGRGEGTGAGALGFDHVAIGWCS